jgi:MFS family permease
MKERSLLAAAEVFRSPDLRRAQLAWALHLAAEWLYLVALGLFAYEAGGATAVGLAGLLFALPGAFTVPFASLLADRFRRERIVLAVGIGRAALLAASALAAFVAAPAWLLFALAGGGALLASGFRPAQAALVPLLVRTPRELVAANIASSTGEGLATFVGPAAAGITFSAAGAPSAFALASVLFLASGFAVVGIDTERQPVPRRARLADEATLGFRHVASNRNVRLLIGLFGVQTLVRGALTTLLVVAALELLEVGETGVGLLNSALGVGGLAGGLLALGLVGRKRLGGPFASGLALWGLPIALIGVWPEPAVALVFLALVGAGNTIVDVAGMTLLQRLVSDRVLARVLGVVESLALAAIGLGAFAVSFLVEAVGLRPALLVTGGLLPVVAVLSLRGLVRADTAALVPARELEVARSVDLFASLPANVVEQLARSLFPVAYPAGTRVVREGDSADRFYVVTEGIAEVARDGRIVAALGPGDYFGEIGLLHGVPRTATVTARTEVSAYALDADDFVAAVAGHRRGSRTAEAVIETRLADLNAAA